MRRLPSDAEALSEIVGALLLVAVVSSAAFGFGVFLHQQAKITEAQKAAEQERHLEAVEVRAVAPKDVLDAACAAGSDGTWDSITITVASVHLHDTAINTVRLNGIAVQHASIGGTDYDFTQPDTRIALKPRQQVTIELKNIDSHSGGACPPADPYSLAGTPAAQPIAVSDSLQVEVVTDLTNRFERVFVPPSAQAALEPTPGAAGTYTLVGTGSRPDGDGVSLVRWEWDYWQAATCGGAGGTGPLSGHRVQVTGLTVGQPYCARLKVTDSNGLWSTADVAFTA